MLPGGISVLGIFIISPGNCFNDNSSVQKIMSILSAIHNNLASHTYLYGNSNYENLVLNFDSSTKQ